MNLIDMLNEAWTAGYESGARPDEEAPEGAYTSINRQADVHRIFAQRAAADMVIEVVDDLPNALRTLEEAALDGHQLHGDDIQRLRATVNRLISGGWQPIEKAPHDRLVLVYAPGIPEVHLPYIMCTCQWHEDAGFCIDELRTPTHWTPLPEPPDTNPFHTYVDEVADELDEGAST